MTLAAWMCLCVCVGGEYGFSAKNHKMLLKMSENVILSGSGLFLTDSMVYFDNTAKVWWIFFLDAA